MKFSDLKLGKRNERTVELPLLAGEEGAETAVKVVVVPADGDESGDIASFALEYARSKGAKDPKDGDPLYDLGALIRTLALTVLDAESTTKPRAKFFDGGNADVQTLPRETMVYLFERQQTWQSEVSPTCKDMGPAEFMSAVIALAKAEDDGFFVGLLPGTRWKLAHFMALLLVPLLEGKSPPSSLSALFPTSPSPTVQ